MSLTVADLLAKLSLDTSGFRKGAEEASAASKKIEDAAGKAGQATEGAGQSATKGGKSFGDLSKSLNDTTQKFTELLTPANLFGTVIGVTVVGALKSAVASAFEFSSELRRLSLVTGDSLGRVAEFQGAVDKLGIGSDKLTRAFFFLSSEMENGGANLARLGIELHTTEGYEKSVIDITEEVGDKFRAMGAGAEVAAAARKLLGRQAVDMLPVFQLEREQIKQLGEEEKRFADQIGIDGVIALTKFRGSLMEVGGAVTRVQTLLTLDLAGAFKSVTDTTSSAIDVLLLVPKPIRLAGEAAIAAGLAMIALSIAAKTLGLALGLVNPWVLAIGVGLAVIVAIGPSVMAAIASLLPQVVIDAWQSFSSAVGSAFHAMKNFLGLGPKEVLGPPESLAAKQKYEPTLADEQKRLQFTQQLTAANIALGQATMTSEAAQINAIKATLAQRLDELAVIARFDTTPTNLARTAALRTAAQKTADAQIAQIASQTQLQLLAIEEQTAEQRLAIEGKSRDAALAMRVDEIEQAKKLVADEYAAFGLSQIDYVNETIRLNSLELTAKQAAITQEIGQVRAAQQFKALLLNQQVAAHAITQAKADEELVKLQVDTDAKLIDLRTKADTTKREVTNQNRELEKKATLEELTFVAQAENRDLALKIANLEAYKRAHTESVKVVEAATAEQYRLLKSAYDKDVQNYIDAQLKQTGILQDEVGKRLAREAGLINSLKQLWQQQIDNQATVLEQQARLAGDLGAAYQVGFAQAATAADDAFAVMKKSGAEAFTTLKSGLSDFLYDVFTGAKNIGDVFVNLGKRILRSMTDVFAEILVKQAAMAAGFSLTGVLGITSGASAEVLEQARVTAAANAELGIFTDTVATSTDSLTGLTGILGLVMRVLTMFGSGLMGILGFFGNIVQGIASGGGIVNTLTSAFGGLVKSGGALYSIFNGLSNVGSSLFSVFTEGTSLANVFQAAFNALGLTSGGFASAAGTASWGAATSATGGAPLAAGQLAGSFASFLGEWVPIAGALYMAAMAIQNFFNGDAAVKIGTGIGLILAGPFGGYLGGIIGGLFANDPIAKLKASIAPFNRNAIGETILNAPGPNGHIPAKDPRLGWATQVGAGIVDVGGNVLSSRKEDALQLALAGALNNLLKQVVSATVLMIKTLPPTIGAQLDAALTDIETHGLMLEDWRHKGKNAGKRLKQHIEGFMGDALQAMVTGLDFGNVDLKTLGFDPKDPKGKNGGEVARGFDAMMMALGGLSAIVREVGPAVDLSSVSLAQFTKGAIDLFKSFAKEGEAFIDTVKRVMGTFSEIVQVMDQNRALIASLTGDVGAAFGTLVGQVKRADEQVVALADALTVAVESGAKPEEVLAAAKAVQAAIQAELQAVQTLKGAVDALNSAIMGGLNYIVSLTQKIDTLQGGQQSYADAQAFSDQMIGLFTATTDVTMRIALFSTGLLGAAENLSLLTERMPTVVAGFNMIMEQIRGMTNPQQALSALKSLSDGIEASLQADIAAVNRQTQAQISALTAQKSQIQQNMAAQKTALEHQKTLETKNFDAQKQALQTALNLSQQWVSVLQSVKTQLVDLFNLLAPTHPLTSLNDVRGQFESAFSQFQAGPTPEGATHVQDLAKQLLDLAKQTPGFELPSAAFQGLAGEVQTALEAIQTVAAAQPTQEGIQAQIAALDQQQAESLARIDATISAMDATQSAVLASIDQQIASASAAGQAQIAEFQGLAAAGLEGIRTQAIIETNTLVAQQVKAAAELQVLLGDKTYEQFMVAKQQEAADLLRGIDRTLQDYLGSIITNLFPGVGVPHMAEGGIVTRPTLALIGEAGPEAVIPLSRASGRSRGGDTTVNISFTYAGSARRDEWDRFLDTVIEDARFGKLGKVITAKVKGQ